MKIKKYIPYIDIIRLIACFSVIINHTNYFMLEHHDNLINSAFFCISFAFSKIGVALFLMITGTLILDKEYTYKKILKCIFKVLIPVLVLSLLFYIKDVGFNNINFFGFVKSIISEPYSTPYWYIYALIGVYLAIPFLQKMIRNFKSKDYVIFIIFFSLFPSFINVLKLYFKIDISYNFSMTFLPMIISFVICGNYISKIKLSSKYFIMSCLIFVISHFFMFLSMYLPYLNNKTISYILDSWDVLPVVLMSISLFYIVRYLFENKTLSQRNQDILYKISSTTFGIYLIHSNWNYKLHNLNIINCIFDYNPILGIIILDVIVFLICMVIIFILKKIPIVKKFL